MKHIQFYFFDYEAMMKMDQIAQNRQFHKSLQFISVCAKVQRLIMMSTFKIGGYDRYLILERST